MGIMIAIAYVSVNYIVTMEDLIKEKIKMFNTCIIQCS